MIVLIDNRKIHRNGLIYCMSASNDENTFKKINVRRITLFVHSVDYFCVTCVIYEESASNDKY